MKAYRNILAVLLAIVISFSFPCISFALDDTAVQEIEVRTVEERAEEILSSMTLEEKVAQMFMVYMPNKKATAIQKKYQFGGYLLFANNFKNNSYKKKQSQIKAYQKASKLNMLIAVDEEGGTVNRVSIYKQYRKSPFLSPQKLNKKGGLPNIRKDTKSKAKLLLDLGINTNLAPVADTPYSKRDYIYYRTFSTSSKKNSKYIKTVIKEMGKNNLVSTLKHFPGYGNNTNTHTGMSVDKRSWESFEERDLKPFKAGVDAGVPFLMVSHNVIDDFDKGVPASLSKKLHNYIRNDMNYDGIILCDGLGMSGVRDYVGGDKGEVAVRAVMAGNDMLCATDVGVQLRAIVKAVNDGRIEFSQIEDSVTRIIMTKINYGLIEKE